MTAQPQDTTRDAVSIEVEAALDDLLEDAEGTVATWRLRRYVDRILAVVRPAGVTLDGEIARHKGSLAHDVRIAAEAIDGSEFGAQARAQRLRTLAGWLDAS